MSLRTTATFEGEHEKLLKAWAKKEYRTAASLVMAIVNSVLDGKPLEVPEGLVSSEATNDRAREFIKNLAFGRTQNILDVQRLADELGVPSERLAQIIVKQNGGDRKNAANKR